jgi:hypothetical protein
LGTLGVTGRAKIPAGSGANVQQSSLRLSGPLELVRLLALGFEDFLEQEHPRVLADGRGVRLGRNRGHRLSSDPHPGQILGAPGLVLKGA